MLPPTPLDRCLLLRQVEARETADRLAGEVAILRARLLAVQRIACEAIGGLLPQRRGDIQHRFALAMDIGNNDKERSP